jgi:hypothetical protein
MKKSAVKVTFSQKVTRDELIASLDQILKIHGCLACGLVGWDGIFFLGDPESEISHLKEGLTEKFKSVINVERFTDVSGIQNELPMRIGF